MVSLAADWMFRARKIISVGAHRSRLRKECAARLIGSRRIGTETVRTFQRSNVRTWEPFFMTELTKHEPTTIYIKPSTGFTALNLRDLWLYRELVFFMVWRDIKVRYKQTLLGAA